MVFSDFFAVLYFHWAVEGKAGCGREMMQSQMFKCVLCTEELMILLHPPPATPKISHSRSSSKWKDI